MMCKLYALCITFSCYSCNHCYSMTFLNYSCDICVIFLIYSCDICVTFMWYSRPVTSEWPFCIIPVLVWPFCRFFWQDDGDAVRQSRQDVGGGGLRASHWPAGGTAHLSEDGHHGLLRFHGGVRKVTYHCEIIRICGEGGGRGEGHISINSSEIINKFHWRAKTCQQTCYNDIN